MTEKRFNLGEDGAWTWVIDNTELDNGYDGHVTARECVDLLNDLHEERNYFERKKEEFLSKWSIAHTENIQLRQENEELKQDNDIKFWKLQLIEQWNTTQLISHELYLAIENGYEISDEFKKHLDDLKKKHEEHMKKAERLGI